MLAVLEGIRAYRIYLSDKKFTIYTDHKALKYVMDQKRSTGRLARWAMEIQGYQFDMIHRPGKNNEVADALSRRVYSENDKQVEDTVVASLSSGSKPDSLQNLDSDSNETEMITSSLSTPCTQVSNDISELTEVSFFYSEIPDILTIDSEVEISLQNPNLSDLAEIAKLQQNCPDFRLIMIIYKMVISLMEKKLKTKSSKIRNIMKSVTEFCIIGFKDVSSALSYLMTNGFNNLHCPELSEMKH